MRVGRASGTPTGVQPLPLAFLDAPYHFVGCVTSWASVVAAHDRTGCGGLQRIGLRTDVWSWLRRVPNIFTRSRQEPSRVEGLRTVQPLCRVVPLRSAADRGSSGGE